MKKKRFVGKHIGTKQCTKTIRTNRITSVIELLIDGYSTAEITIRVQPEWGVTPRTIKRYISQAHKELAKSTEVERKAELVKAIRRFHIIYKEAMDNKDHKTALSAASKICEVLKLGELGKLDVNISGDLKHEHSITPDQAETIFGILEGAGAFEAFSPSAKAE